ncbi:MAG: hypothetical protein WC855_10970 [Thermodesulfovibrionales bacterium]
MKKKNTRKGKKSDPVKKNAINSKIGGKLNDYFISAIICYFTAFLLDRIIFQKHREIKIDSSLLTIYRPGDGLDLLSYYFLSVLMLFLFLYVIKMFKKKNIWLVSIVLSPLIAIAALYIGKDLLLAKVEPKMSINGQVKNPKLYNYLFVRPVDSSNCWLQEPIPLMPDQEGKWRIGAYFGGQRGQQFEIIAIASKTPLHPIPFISPGQYDCTQIPDVAERFIRLVKLK